MNNFCLYHASCPDGFAAALAVWQKYGELFTYIPVQYQQPIPEMKDIDKLFIVDFSFPKDQMIELEERCKQLVVIDHHDLKGRLNDWIPKKDNIFIYDPDHSGAYLTWQFFNILSENEQPVPLFFRYIEDRDLWKWQLPDSRAFSAGLDLEERTFERWNNVVTIYSKLNEVIDNGYIVLKFINQKVKSLTEKAVILKDQNNLTYATVNSPHFQSELGEYLCQNKDIDYADIYFLTEQPRIIVHSLRSQGRTNVTDIAKSKGGGGHPSGRAAGYSEALNA